MSIATWMTSTSICGPVRWVPHPVAVRRRRPTGRNPRWFKRHSAWRADMAYGVPIAGFRAAALLAAVPLLPPQMLYAHGVGLGRTYERREGQASGCTFRFRG